MAGVSSGTVDRVLHNRGGVSESSRKAVERILTEVGYRYNIHTSAVSLTKEFNLVITTPSGIPGEYWGSVMSGIEHALKEFSDINIHFRQALYNQFDVYSCRSAFESVLEMSPDAVIIGPTFASETVRLCNELDKSEVPYVFVDSVIDGTSPVASYTTDQYACGHLLGRLLSSFTPSDAKFAICGTARVGDERSNNTRERKKGSWHILRRLTVLEVLLKYAFPFLIQKKLKTLFWIWWRKIQTSRVLQFSIREVM